MEIDNAKLDEFALALLYLTTFENKHGQVRAWKSHDWGVLDRLHESGYIDDPVSKAKSVVLTDEGAKRSKQAFREAFYERLGLGCPQRGSPRYCCPKRSIRSSSR